MLGIIITAIIAFVADRFSKWFMVSRVFGMDGPVVDSAYSGESIELIEGVFQLTYRTNEGIAWSMLSGRKLLITLLSLAVLGILCFIIYKLKPKSLFAIISLGLIIGGAAGNLYDRFVYGYVIDFLDFCVINYPVFNVADCCVVIGAIAFCIYYLFFFKEEDAVGKD